MTDSEYMRLALQLAQKGAGRVSPNPMVGAVIVKDGVVIGQGYHQEYGGLHAERNALADCTKMCIRDRTGPFEQVRQRPGRNICVNHLCSLQNSAISSGIGLEKRCIRDRHKGVRKFHTFLTPHFSLVALSQNSMHGFAPL